MIDEFDYDGIKYDSYNFDRKNFNNYKYVTFANPRENLSKIRK